MAGAEYSRSVCNEAAADALSWRHPEGGPLSAPFRNLHPGRWGPRRSVGGAFLRGAGASFWQRHSLRQLFTNAAIAASRVRS